MNYTPLGCSGCRTAQTSNCGVSATDPVTDTPGIPTCVWVVLVGWLLFSKRGG